jgi:hypothetical protein
MFIGGLSEARIIIESGGFLDFSQSSGQLKFYNIQFEGAERIVTTTNNPNSILFKNSRLAIGEIDYTFFPSIFIAGICSFATAPGGSLRCADILRLQSTSIMTLESLSTLTVGSLILPLRGTEFILDNATLDFYNTDSLGLAVQLGNLNIASLSGKMTVLGQSQLKSSGKHDIIVPKGVEFLIGSSARLTLDQGVTLAFE